MIGTSGGILDDARSATCRRADSPVIGDPDVAADDDRLVDLPAQDQSARQFVLWVDSRRRSVPVDGVPPRCGIGAATSASPARPAPPNRGSGGMAAGDECSRVFRP